MDNNMKFHDRCGVVPIEQRLNLILEQESTQIADDPYMAATNIATELENARRRVSELERQFLHAMDRLCGGLAVGIRKFQPGLNVGLDGGCCRIGYKAKNMLVRPDFGKKMWVVDGSDQRFIKRFLRNNAAHVQLDSNLEPIAKAIADFFTGHYLSLGEAMTGRGLLLLDGRRVGLGDLVSHLKELDRLLVEQSFV